MASPPPQGTIKNEPISISQDNGKGTLLVIRPGKNGQQLGQLNQFDYEGNAAMKILNALAVARRQLEEKIAAAKVAPAVKPALKTPAVVIDPEEGDASLPVIPDDEEDNEATEATVDDAPETPELEPEAVDQPTPMPTYVAMPTPAPTTAAQHPPGRHLLGHGAPPAGDRRLRPGQSMDDLLCDAVQQPPR